MNRLCIVVPCYNEEEALAYTNKELISIIQRLVEAGKVGRGSFILYVDDGSRDKTWNIIEEYHKESPFVYGLKLAKNSGHQNALTAGLLAAKDYGDMIVSIDADLQDDVSVIEEMVDKFIQGYDIVYGVRKKRDTDTFFKRTTALGFYRLMRAMKIDIVYNHADYRLMSKRAVEVFSRYEERNLFLRGIIPLIGYRSTVVTYDRKLRIAGESKYPFSKMLSMAFEGITSFSIQPILMITNLGLLIVLFSILAAIYGFYSYLSGRVVAGWTSIILSIWFIGGVQLLSVGLIGTYIGKIYIEVKQRPRYNVETNNLLEKQHEES
ncbi:putative glycosyltransferase YkoT [Lacrimispora xylanolytica]|jgi:glycosyltransferase involved in cell wall biosynthesis|uniref:Glycosyltransferase family 2 protein n=1 Tax=Lacrimispora xylanolytica TaxID=29375 RepID=A0ABY7AF17_9FIRM|nr:MULTISPECIES: glycosyltransferase family 2 protein [Clostridia]MBS5958876.1 glycosyltransferase family 2 protein [Clostridiales bacterium]WAJ25320.1 glycosyltransferase family 2 protein [Lacrimispora xylanolytica]